MASSIALLPLRELEISDKMLACGRCGALLMLEPCDIIASRDTTLRLRSIDRKQYINNEEDKIPHETIVETENVTEMNENTIEKSILPELIWENQQLDDNLQWISCPQFGYNSCNRQAVGSSIEDLFSKVKWSESKVWKDVDWEVDYSVPNCDAQGWVYAVNRDSFSKPISEEQENKARRRRLVRRRYFVHSELELLDELMDCNSLLLNKYNLSCHDCENARLLALEAELKSLEEDHEGYQLFLATMQNANNYDENERCWTLRQRIHKIKVEEQNLQAQLDTLEYEKLVQIRKRQELWDTGEDLDKLIRGTFAEGSFLQHLLGINQDERQSSGVYSVHVSDMLRRLNRCDIRNDVFYIWHDGQVGTINGLRLGRLPSKAVDWQEINAALGHVVLLLATIADQAQFEFVKFKLIPRGSYSKIANIHGREYNLYSDGGFLRRRHFNQAIALLLECVDEAGKLAQKRDPSLQFPFEIERGKIGNFSILLGNDDHWTKALKFMLVHLKKLLAWVAKQQLQK